METTSHLFHAAGRALIWVATALAIEEMTLGGLALLLLSLATKTGSNKKEAKR